MAVLTTAQRHAMPSHEFAGPHRSFPIPDHIHAEKALQLLPRAEAAGHVTPEQAAHIRAAAHAKLHEHHKRLAHALRSHNGGAEHHEPYAYEHGEHMSDERQERRDMR